MKNIIRDSFKFLRVCGKALLQFEIVFKSLSVALFYPLFLYLFKLTLKLAGIRYLTNGYIYKYLRSPATIAAIVVLLSFLSLFIYLEKCCISVLLDGGRMGCRIGFLEMVVGGLKGFKRSFGKKHIAIFFYEIFLFPFSNIVSIGLAITNITLPEYVVRAFGSRNRMYAIALIVVVVLFILAIRQIFTTNGVLFEDRGFVDSYRQSSHLVRGRIGRILAVMLFWNVIIGTFVGLVFVIIAGCAISGVFLLNLTHNGIVVFISVIKMAKTILTLMLVLLSVPLSYIVISSMYFNFRKEDNGSLSLLTFSEAAEYVLKKPPIWKRGVKKTVRNLTVISCVMICCYVLQATINTPFGKVELFNEPEITAHRGSSSYAPENTMAAFDRAVIDMADYIELDVHTTSDGVVVVLHDANLYRTTGLKQQIYLTGYSKVSKLDAGSWFSPEFAGEGIPTLDEVLGTLGHKINLNIEIKYSKREPELAKKVVGLIEKYGVEERCIITSSDYDVLCEVKKLNSEIRTGYVLSAAYGAYYNIKYVDVISINYSYVTRALVNSIHDSGKEIYVWTINSPSKIRALANMGVDNIITDDPVSAREALYSRYAGKEIVNILNYIFDRSGY